MNKKPNKWIAVFLGFFLSPMGLLYVGKPLFALLVLITSLLLNYYGQFYASESLDFFITIFLWCFYGFISVYAYNKALNYKGTRLWYSKWYGQIGVLIAFQLPIMIFRAYYFEPFYIPASSMSPNINMGEHIVVNKKGCGNYKLFGIQVNKSQRSESCKIERGDVIVFEYPPDKNIDYVKCVIGVGNDKISYHDKVLKINGIKIENKLISVIKKESIIEEQLGDSKYQILHMERSYDLDGDWIVPDGFYFVMGDNRENSSDSRSWGFVPESNVIGTLYHVFKK